MKYIISSNRGERIAVADDKKEARKIGRHYAQTTGAVMIYYASDSYQMLGYSSEDTAAANCNFSGRS